VEKRTRLRAWLKFLAIVSILKACDLIVVINLIGYLSVCHEDWQRPLRYYTQRLMRTPPIQDHSTSQWNLDWVLLQEIPPQCHSNSCIHDRR